MVTFLIKDWFLNHGHGSCSIVMQKKIYPLVPREKRKFMKTLESSYYVQYNITIRFIF